MTDTTTADKPGLSPDAGDAGGNGIRLAGIELRRIEMPLVAPFRTSFGTQRTKEALLLRVVTAAAEGWGECVAETEPLYSSEYLDACLDVLRRFLIPALAARRTAWTARPSARPCRPIPRSPDGEGRARDGRARRRAAGRGVPLGRELGAVRDRVPCGVSVGIMDSIGELLDVVGGYLDEGYVRIKLKIEPGWDVDAGPGRARALRRRPALQVDANAAYTLADAQQLAEARRVRPAADRAAAAPRTTSWPTPTWPR